MLKRSLCAIAMACFSTSYSHAQDSGFWPEMYVAFAGGAVQEEVTTHNFVDISNIHEYDYNSGYALQGTLGFYLPNNFMGELEITYRESSVDEEIQANVFTPGFAGGGEITSTTYMANLLYNIPVTETSSIFAGGGVGIADIEANVFDVPSGFVFMNAEDSRFAYQLILGLNFEMNEKVSVFAKYNYLDAGEDSVNTFNTGVGVASRPVTYSNNSFLGGIKIKLN